MISYSLRNALKPRSRYICLSCLLRQSIPNARQAITPYSTTTSSAPPAPDPNLTAAVLSKPVKKAGKDFVTSEIELQSGQNNTNKVTLSQSEKLKSPKGSIHHDEEAARTRGLEVDQVPKICPPETKRNRSALKDNVKGGITDAAQTVNASTARSKPVKAKLKAGSLDQNTGGKKGMQKAPDAAPVQSIKKKQEKKALSKEAPQLHHEPSPTEDGAGDAMIDPKEVPQVNRRLSASKIPGEATSKKALKKAKTSSSQGLRTRKFSIRKEATDRKASVRKIDFLRIRKLPSTAEAQNVDLNKNSRAEQYIKARLRRRGVAAARRSSHVEKPTQTEFSRLQGNKSLKTALNEAVGVHKSLAENVQIINTSDLQIAPLEIDQPAVPNLSYGLERVLFNPGVYHLQDPRSCIFNFDPYLQKIMPVSEFDFNALKEYITSSRDQSLKLLAQSYGKRYVGSSSSMTGALAHFHFLLSQWRPIDTSMMSQGFPDKLRSFTLLQRCPSAIFLRWRNGSYAIDADKEFASANILSMLGKSMEKLLTLSTEGYERYRKSSSDPVSREETAAPESFHYCTMGDFLMRSQLDAYDARLPGTGMFDLKTRAVVSIRMDARNIENGKGYEIKSRQGQWESFEREYFDMIRSAFLKYSLQVRMGRMDGIFVAFHNTERIFGFQYISLPEMDASLHGQSNVNVGDQEFKLSLDLLNKILDRATIRFPEQSLRIHFETREAQTPFMYIFAEPVTEEQVKEVQSMQDEKIREFERSILGRCKEDIREEERPSTKPTEWADLHANVQEAMENDEKSLYLKPTNDHPLEKQATSYEVAETHEAHPLPDVANHGPLYAKQNSLMSSKQAPLVAADQEEVDENDKEDEEYEDGSGNVEGYSRLENLRHNDLSSTEENHESMKPNYSTDHAQAFRNESDNENENGFPEPTSESSNTPLEDSETEGDSVFLDKISREQDSQMRSASADILALTLTVRNKVNNQYVLRPGNLKAEDHWTVEYALAEISPPTRAWSLYRACQLRRKKKLEDTDDAEDGKADADYFLRQMRDLSRKGRQWRLEQDKLEEGRPTVVLSQSSPTDRKMSMES